MRLSIITVCYNSAGTIEQSIQSVLEQTYPHIEYIIIDGKSTDGTLEIIDRYRNRVAHLVSEPDGGIYDAMNKGVALATGEVVGILNSDDVYSGPHTLEKIMRCFQSDPDLAAVYGNISYFRDHPDGPVVRYWRSKPYYPRFFDDGESPPHPAMFVRRKVYEHIGAFKPALTITADQEFMFRMLKIHQYPSLFIDETLVKMRLGGLSTRGLKSYWITTLNLIQVWRMNGMKYPWKLFFLRPIKKLRQLILR